MTKKKNLTLAPEIGEAALADQRNLQEEHEKLKREILDELLRLTRETEAAKRELRRADMQREAMVAELAELKREASAHQETLREKALRAEQEGKQARQELEKARQELERAHRSLTDRQWELELTKRSLTERQSELDKMRKEDENLRNRLRGLEGDISSKGALLEDLSRREGTLRNELQQLAEERSALRIAQEKLERELSSERELRSAAEIARDKAMLQAAEVQTSLHQARMLLLSIEQGLAFRTQKWFYVRAKRYGVQIPVLLRLFIGTLLTKRRQGPPPC